MLWVIVFPVLVRFQFQYGSIGGTLIKDNKSALIRFQFQYGSIGGLSSTFSVTIGILFQFQYGSIGGDYSGSINALTV